MKTKEMKTEDHKFEILAKRIVKFLGDGYVMSTVVHGIFGCSVYVEDSGQGVMIGNSDETNLEMAYKDLIDTYFILEKGVGNSSFGFGIASVSYSGLEMKLSLRGF